MTSPTKGRVRPSILFSQTPHSISRRARQLPNTAAELLRYLCELTIGFGRGYIELTYTALAQALGKSWTTIARAVQVLRRQNHIAADHLKDGSYRWYVLLEPQDIKADPQGIYRLRAPQDHPNTIADSMPPHVISDMTPMSKAPGGDSKNDMTPIAEMTWGHPPQADSANPDGIKAQSSSDNLETEPLKIDLKDTNTQRYHQRGAAPLNSPLSQERDDESLDHKMLLGKLQQYGVKQRMSRQLLNRHPHHLIAQVLDHVSQRQDIENPAGYIVRELEDGGYNQVLAPRATPSPKETPEALISHQGAERTRTEREQLETEKQHKEVQYRQNLKALSERYQTLADSIKAQLKTLWTKRVEQMLPNTKSKKTMLADPTFQRIAFKEVTESFFEHLDQGLAPELAIDRAAA